MQYTPDMIRREHVCVCMFGLTVDWDHWHGEVITLVFEAMNTAKGCSTRDENCDFVIKHLTTSHASTAQLKLTLPAVR